MRGWGDGERDDEAVTCAGILMDGFRWYMLKASWTNETADGDLDADGVNIAEEVERLKEQHGK